MLGTREEAEDALQHVFVSAHKHLAARDEIVDLRPWLYAIARNRCLSVLRSRKEAVARVWLMPGSGKVTINKRDIDNYFGRATSKMILRQPLQLTGW